MASSTGGPSGGNGGTANPTSTQKSGKWISAQRSSVKGLNRPSDPEALARAVALNSGGTLTLPDPQKINKIRSTFDPRAFSKTTLMPDKTDLKFYSWNLPPHEWSRPIDPTQYDNIIANSQSWDQTSNPVNRRGRIYWYARNDSTWMTAKTKNVGKNNDPRYGFHFIWNPETFSTSVSVNPDITPTVNDKFTKVAGAFPSNQVLTVSLVLDRTNDMYCLRSHDSSRTSFIGTFDTFYPYYRGHSFEDFSAKDPVKKESFEKKIQDLQTLGTISDIEYLYKAINGPGWKNPANGRETSDIGFLAMTLLKIEIGPLSYIGYVSSISINHETFTKAMIPMRSTVNLQFNLMATAGLASGGEITSQ